MRWLMLLLALISSPAFADTKFSAFNSTTYNAGTDNAVGWRSGAPNTNIYFPLAASAITNALNATNINSGTLNTARLPNPFTSGTASGNTTTFGTTSGALTSGDCVKFDASGNLVDAGAACGTGGGDTITSPNSTLTVGGTTTNTTLDFNLGNANVWTASQLVNIAGITNTSTLGGGYENTTASTVGSTVQWSPFEIFTGHAWKSAVTAADQEIDFKIENQTATGAAAATGNLVISEQSNGGGYNSKAYITNVGNGLGGSLSFGLGAVAAGVGFGYNDAGSLNVFSAGSPTVALGSAFATLNTGSIGFTTSITGAFARTKFTDATNGGFISTVNARASATAKPYFDFLTPADTALTASTESIGLAFGGDTSQATVTRQFATGNFATQRENVFVAPTYGAVGASTITTAATVAITGAPATGTNATLTTPLALWIQGGNSQFGGNVASTGTVSGSTVQATTYNVGSGGGIIQMASTNQIGFYVGSTGNPQVAFDAGGGIHAVQLRSDSNLSWNSSTSFPASGSNGDTNITRDAAGVIDIGTGALGSTAGNMKLNNITKYNGVATVSAGVPSEIGVVDSLNNSAAITATTLATPAASGLFRVSIILQVTRASDISSILGGTTGVVITYTEPDGSVAQTIVPALDSQAGALVVPANGNTGNTTTTQSQGTAVIYAKSGVAIQYAVGYSSTQTTTSMQYSVHLKLESL